MREMHLPYHTQECSSVPDLIFAQFGGGQGLIMQPHGPKFCFEVFACDAHLYEFDDVMG